MSSDSDSTSSSDSESSSSQESSKQSSETEIVKTTALDEKNQKKSIDSKTRCIVKTLETKKAAVKTIQPVKTSKTISKSVLSSEDSQKQLIKEKINIKPNSTAANVAKLSATSSNKLGSNVKPMDKVDTKFAPGKNKGVPKSRQAKIPIKNKEAKKRSIFSIINNPESKCNTVAK